MTARVANRGEVSDFLSLFSRFHRFPFLLFLPLFFFFFFSPSSFLPLPLLPHHYYYLLSLIPPLFLYLLPLFSLYHPILPFFSTLEPYPIDYYSSFRVDYTGIFALLTLSQLF